MMETGKQKKQKYKQEDKYKQKNKIMLVSMWIKEGVH